MPGRVKGPAGPPADGEPAFLAVGLVRRSHGLKGEAVVELYTDFPERLQPKKVLYAGEKHIPLTIRSARQHNEGLLLAFEGINTPEEAGRYRNHTLYVPVAAQPELPDGEFYHHELLGMQVLDENGNILGTLMEILPTGANDVYVVRNPSGGELLLPAIPEVILDVDLQENRMRVHLLPGLVEEENNE